jgi:glycerate kinase
MRFLVASGGHKHLLSASQACAYVAEGIRQALPEAEVRTLPMADGGEGTIDALVQAAGGSVASETVYDPLCRPRQARLGLLADGNTAVIELAEAAGSALLACQERQTMVATSHGVGELIAGAVRRGRRRVVVGLGGCIASDMGMGMAQALGVVFLDAAGNPLTPFPGPAFNAMSLLDVCAVRPEAALNLLRGLDIEVASDVDIPLLGANGQARTFGPQKGASQLEIAWLERGFANLAHILLETSGRDVNVPLAGAGGGLGAGLLGFFGARLSLGARLVADMAGLAQAVDAADLVVVGEGCLDATTLMCKTPWHVACLAAERGKPVLAVVGAVHPAFASELFPTVAGCFAFGRDAQGLGAPEAARALTVTAERAVRNMTRTKAAPVGAVPKERAS